jgi:transposase
MVMEDTSQQVITAQSSAQTLPDDVATLRQMVLSLLADVDAKNVHLMDLKQQLAWFQRHTFGRRSEKYPADHPVLFDLLNPAASEPPAAKAPASSKGPTTGAKTSSSRRNGRTPLPAHLPREPIEHPVPEAQLTCPCCGRAKTRIGQEVSEELDYVPASFVVRQHIRPKYACKHCQDGVVIAPLPDRPIDKGRAGTGLFSHILVSKYADHLPLHRQEGIYRRHGLDLPRSTLCDWVAQSAALLDPLVVEMKRQILTGPKLHTDDTPVPVRDGPRPKMRKGYLWVYIDPKKNVVFDYTPTRQRAGPMDFLGDYEGFVQADAYAGYDAVFARGKATEVGCWAHTRRKFYEAKDTAPAVAHEALLLIRDLYKIERQAKDERLDDQALLDLRQEHSKPILATIERRLPIWSQSVLPKSPMATAIGYAQGQWEALIRYAENPLLAIDNNLAERTLRTVALGRKNWLFAGSEAGAYRAATIYSLIGSCKLCGIDPFYYLKDVLERISHHPARRIEELLPCQWRPATAD